MGETKITYHDTFENEIEMIRCWRNIDFSIQPLITLIALNLEQLLENRFFCSFLRLHTSSNQRDVGF